VAKPSPAKLARRVELHGQRVTGAAVLAGPLAALRAIEGLAERAAPAVARELERQILANVAASRDPDGRAWPRTLDGHAPLQGVAKDLRVTARGSRVVATISGVGARHNLGAVKGGRLRQVLPSLRVPGAMAEAIKSAVDDEIKRSTGAT